MFSTGMAVDRARYGLHLQYLPYSFRLDIDGEFVETFDGNIFVRLVMEVLQGVGSERYHILTCKLIMDY
ncbi:MAG: hypothetical protein CSYNP_00257 [Syntrophus sp. SKADARSKE-3]|nr:hypothetical protein [Syntrophus sp. SKADARSKE-3]